MRLETDRLIVRDFTMGDLPALWDIFRDEEAMEHMAPMTEEETEEFLRSFCVERTPPGAFAAQLREAGLVGYVLFNQVDAPGIYELGWVFRRDCWGRGLAREGTFRRHGLGRDGNWKDIYWYGLLREEYVNGTDRTHP